jgi:hypothetical protein
MGTDAYAKLGLPEPGEYERVWIEATTGKPGVAPEARTQPPEMLKRHPLFGVTITNSDGRGPYH